MARGVKPNLPKVKCEFCGLVFKKKTQHQRFCSRYCEQKNISIVNPVSHRIAYKKWYEKLMKEDPDFHKKRYYKRKSYNYEKFKEQRNRYQKNQYQKLRNLALEKYGNKCDCCGENKKEFLSIDHIRGGGNKHKKEIKVNIYRWLYKNDYPKEFRVLCHNCNMSLGFYGYCPHKKL